MNFKVGENGPYAECDVVLCDFWTGNPKEIREHVTKVHDWSEEKAEKLIEEFKEFKTENSGTEDQRIENPTDIEVPSFAKKGKIREEVLETLELDIKKDKDTAESILSVGLSAYSNEPQNIFLRGPSSVGKSHAITSTMNYLPEEDVELLGSLSPKALVHQRGKLVDGDGNPLPPEPQEENFEDSEKFKGAKKRWEKKAKNAKNLIDLQGKILVFLEAPPKKTYEMLRPILSHDTWEHEHKFAESSSSGIHTNTVIIRGWPSAIFATTESDFIDDLVTRSLTITPNMGQEKFKAANKYTADKFEIPIEDPETEERKEKLEDYIHSVKKVAQASKIAIPFAEALAEPYPSNKPQDMRDFKKFLSLIRMQTLLHAFQRPLIKLGDVWILVSTPEDLEHALQPFKKSFLTTQTGVSQEIINIYKDIFIPLRGGRPKYEEVIERYNKEMDKPISREWLRTKVVKPLEHIGWLDVEPDPADKRKVQFKVQGEIKTFENLCAEIQEVIDRETVKEWFNKISKIPLSNEIRNRNKAFSVYKRLADSEEVDREYLVRKIGDYKGKFGSSQNTSKYKREEEKAPKTKQNNSKVSQHELAEKLARDYRDLDNPQEISFEEFAGEEADRYDENFDRVKTLAENLKDEKSWTFSSSTRTNIEEVEKLEA